MDYSVTTIFHATKSWKQNTRAIINNYRGKKQVCRKQIVHEKCYF